MDTYTLEEFCEAYDLDEVTAKRLLVITGEDRVRVS